MADESVPNQNQLIHSGSAASIPLAPKELKNKTAGQRYLKFNGMVLCFYGYFKEAVHESSLENHRIRTCELHYYLEDNTIEIVEKKVENSGVPQGTFAKRQRVIKDELADTYMTFDDIQLGGTLSVYGRKMFITDCNASTRNWLRDSGRPDEELIPVPGEEDLYTTMRAEFMSRETGRDETVAHNIRKNPMQEFAEARLGNTVNNSTRSGFLEYDRKVLRFDCLWDDRQALYGDLQRFTLVYYLADDTMEMLTVLGPNCGRDPFKKMVKRGKLPKDKDQPNGPYWHWSDFDCGMVVEVYSRKLLIVAGDSFTVDFFNKKGMPLSEPIRIEQEEPVTTVRELPPYNGYGSEEDSLASCVGSLVPTVPMKKLGENKIMRFQAKMESQNPEDRDRTFTVSFFLIDNTVQIHEPPKRNSGIVGGSFLSRMKLRTDEGLITEEYFYVGAEIILAGHPFILVDADEGTLKHMEGKPATFDYSNLNYICEVYALSLLEVAKSGELLETFQALDPEGTGEVTMKAFKTVLMKYNCSYYFGGPPEQAVITCCRKMGKNRTTLDYRKFVGAILDPESI